MYEGTYGFLGVFLEVRRCLGSKLLYPIKTQFCGRLLDKVYSAELLRANPSLLYFMTSVWWDHRAKYKGVQFEKLYGRFEFLLTFQWAMVSSVIKQKRREVIWDTDPILIIRNSWIQVCFNEIKRINKIYFCIFNI